MPLLQSFDIIGEGFDNPAMRKLVDNLGLKQPPNRIARNDQEALLLAREIGYPLVVRPSYVLGGRAMQIIHSEGQLQTYLLDTVPGLVPEDIKQRYPNDKTGQINTLLGKNPLLFDSYLTNAIEVDVDALCDGENVFVSGIMEHIEEAGIHSGDSACSLPSRSSCATMRPPAEITIERWPRSTRYLPTSSVPTRSCRSIIWALALVIAASAFARLRRDKLLGLGCKGHGA